MPLAVQKSLFRSARQLLLRSSAFTYLISLLLPRKERPFFWVWYSYLRWVDDTVDAVAQSRRKGCDFLDRQLELLWDLYGARTRDLCNEEQFLAALVAYDLGKGGRLQQPLSEMLAAIKFDIQRRGVLAEHDALYENFEREVSSYLFTVAYFCSVPVTPKKLPGAIAAIGAKISHILRDFIADCADAQFNVSRQEIEAYRLDLKNISTEITGGSGRQWVAAKVRVAERQLSTGLDSAKGVESIRYRAIVAILVAKYQTYLHQCRANRLVLKGVASFRWSRFARNVLTNIAVVFLARNRSAPMSRGIERIHGLVPTSRLQQILLCLRLHPACNPSLVALLHQSIDGIEISDAMMLKMRRRFVTAYWLGYSSCAFIDPVRDKDDDARLHVAGLVYAFWSLSAIELDSLVDDHGISPPAAEDLVTGWLDQIANAIKVSNQTPGRRIQTDWSSSRTEGNVNVQFKVLARALQKHLILYSSRALDIPQRERVCDAFSKEAHPFLTAQINSHNQKSLNPAHDWSWYYAEVLNQKTLGFAVAPLSIWSCDGAGIERRRELVRALVALNSAYGHWQLLDDVADLKKDTHQGLVTAPGFILLSQGKLARLVLENTRHGVEFGDSTARLLIEQVRRSRLLCDWFLSSSLCDTYRHCMGPISDGKSQFSDSVGHAIRCALANVENDLSVPLLDLCRYRDSQADGYLTAMRSRDSIAAFSSLSASRTSFRILLAAQEDAARERIGDELSRIVDCSLLMMLQIMEALIARCHAKACTAAVQNA
jgi:phytoene/squalene synthetase